MKPSGGTDMIQNAIVDLDELTLACRNQQARGYIAEATACYRAGAFRACIVATWIAVVYDFLHKLRELELAGDKNARRKLDEFERARAMNDLRASLDFERTVLDSARNDFELLSSLEHGDLANQWC